MLTLKFHAVVKIWICRQTMVLSLRCSGKARQWAPISSIKSWRVETICVRQLACTRLYKQWTSKTRRLSNNWSRDSKRTNPMSRSLFASGKAPTEPSVWSLKPRRPTSTWLMSPFSSSTWQGYSVYLRTSSDSCRPSSSLRRRSCLTMNAKQNSRQTFTSRMCQSKWSRSLLKLSKTIRASDKICLRWKQPSETDLVCFTTSYHRTWLLTWVTLD